MYDLITNRIYDGDMFSDYVYTDYYSSTVMMIAPNMVLVTIMIIVRYRDYDRENNSCENQNYNDDWGSQD